MENRYKVLLYYLYTDISDPEVIREWQYNLCSENDLKGRILIATEGINGTIAGSEKAIDAYMSETSSRGGFSEMEWKISWSSEQVFPKLKVKVRDEIVTLGLEKYYKDSDVSLDSKARYIEPEELLELYEEEKDFLILDARNEYEAKIGKFKNALVPPIDNFREFPKFVESISDYKDKPIVTYCTGGIRCEKASAYMREQGFTNVRQLHGGIHRYADKTGGKHFEGEMFVFDKRLHTKVNSVNPSVISKCVYCETSVSRYVDCEEASCGNLFICCLECQEDKRGLCLNHSSVS